MTQYEQKQLEYFDNAVEKLRGIIAEYDATKELYQKANKKINDKIRENEFFLMTASGRMSDIEQKFQKDTLEAKREILDSLAEVRELTKNLKDKEAFKVTEKQAGVLGMFVQMAKYAQRENDSKVGAQIYKSISYIIWATMLCDKPELMAEIASVEVNNEVDEAIKENTKENTHNPERRHGRMKRGEGILLR